MDRSEGKLFFQKTGEVELNGPKQIQENVLREQENAAMRRNWARYVNTCEEVRRRAWIKVCGICGGLGHYKRRCPLVVCVFCGWPGHMKVVCNDYASYLLANFCKEKKNGGGCRGDFRILGKINKNNYFFQRNNYSNGELRKNGDFKRKGEKDIKAYEVKEEVKEVCRVRNEADSLKKTTGTEEIGLGIREMFEGEISKESSRSSRVKGKEEVRQKEKVGIIGVKDKMSEKRCSNLGMGERKEKEFEYLKSRSIEKEGKVDEDAREEKNLGELKERYGKKLQKQEERKIETGEGKELEKKERKKRKDETSLGTQGMVIKEIERNSKETRIEATDGVDVGKKGGPEDKLQGILEGTDLTAGGEKREEMEDGYMESKKGNLIGTRIGLGCAGSMETKGTAMMESEWNVKRTGIGGTFEGKCEANPLRRGSTRTGKELRVEDKFEESCEMEEDEVTNKRGCVRGEGSRLKLSEKMERNVMSGGSIKASMEGMIKVDIQNGPNTLEKSKDLTELSQVTKYELEEARRQILPGHS